MVQNSQRGKEIEEILFPKKNRLPLPSLRYSPSYMLPPLSYAMFSGVLTCTSTLRLKGFVTLSVCGPIKCIALQGLVTFQVLSFIKFVTLWGLSSFILSIVFSMLYKFYHYFYPYCNFCSLLHFRAIAVSPLR